MNPQPAEGGEVEVDPALLEQLAFRSQLRYLFRRAMTALDATAAEFGLSPMGYHAVLVLGGAGPAGIPEQELVDHLASSRAHTSVLARSLVEQGLIERGPVGPDRRRVTLRLTRPGWQVVAKIADHHRLRMRELVEGWDPSAFEQLMERIMSVYLGLEGRVRVERLEPTSENP
ncbi:MAG: MarR family winged helix-turn-helix transcriptional regulator [Candidatus Dormibacteria bacterium]